VVFKDSVFSRGEQHRRNHWSLISRPKIIGCLQNNGAQIGEFVMEHKQKKIFPSLRRFISVHFKIVMFYLLVKPKPSFWKCYACFGYENKTGFERILVIFQHRPMFSPINGKLSPRPFE